MNNYRKERLIDIARSLVHKKTGKSMHISFILKSNQLLVTATNDYTRQHLAHKFGAYVAHKESHDSSIYVASRHSETNALALFLNKFGNLDMSGLTLFNTRIGANGEAMNAAPCPNCSKVLASLNFKDILFT